jgi:hypothetical protein
VAKEGSANFNIPTEMRTFAEKTMEQARQAFDSFVAAMQEPLSHAETRATSARSGVKDVVDLAMRFSECNIAASFASPSAYCTQRTPRK